MSRPAVWTSIAATLGEEIAQGHYRPGDRLPTEAALAARFGVNRHTVRRALADLAGAGTVVARRGSGVFVAAQPAEYAIGLRTRFHRNIVAAGRTPSRRITRIETRPASPEEASALALAPGDRVHVVEGVSLADGLPLAAFRSAFPAGRLPTLPASLGRLSSITAALADCGVPDYTRAGTRLTARLADPLLALALGVQPGAAVLQSVSVNVDGAGQPVEYGQTWFAGDRVTLTVDPDQP